MLLPAETAALLRELTDPGHVPELGPALQDRERQRLLRAARRGSGAVPRRGPGEVWQASRYRGRCDAQMIRAMFAAAREETRVNGVLLDVGGVRLVATDGRRLAISYQNDVETGDDLAFKVVVPLRALQTLAQALGDEQGDLERRGRR